jgi:methyl-accepting chemotaxis protein
MNKLFVITSALIIFAIFVSVHTSMASDKGGVGGKSMRVSQDMMDDMASIMRQMNGLMDKLSHPMEHMTVSEHAELNKMGKIMHDMAGQMSEMAAHMEKGSMDSKTVDKMRRHMDEINQALQDLRKE